MSVNYMSPEFNMSVNMDDSYNDDSYFIIKAPRIKYVKGCISRSGRTVRYNLTKSIEKNNLDEDIETSKWKYSDYGKTKRNNRFCNYCNSHLCFDPLERKNIKVKNQEFINNNIQITSDDSYESSDE